MSRPRSTARANRAVGPSLRLVTAVLSLLSTTLAQSTTAPKQKGNSIQIVGDSGVSAQQIFLHSNNKVYVIDKTEANPHFDQINGHPAWASEYDLDSNKPRALDIATNTFCAGGNVLGNGTWINVGGNQAIGYGGLNAAPNSLPYMDGDGGKAVRYLNCDGSNNCEWIDDPSLYMTTRRWYPTLETLEDGRIIIVGGCDYGGYVNDAGQNNPTYEYFPSAGGPIGLRLLTTTLPANLFPLIWLLPSGNLFVNANLGNEIFDYKNNVEYPLDDIPHSVRTYPGSAATAMLPLTPANNWTSTIIFCGGTNLKPDQWVVTWNIAAYPTDDSCVSITPDVSTAWVEEQPLPEGRVMGNMIMLPDGRAVVLNGIGKGTAGYGNTSWAIGQSFGDEPIYTIRYYDHNQPMGKRWSAAVANSTVDRMYHSSAVLLPNGCIWSSGSNPNADYVAPGTAGYKYFTEYRVELFCPDYNDKPRPQPKNLPTSLGYGGNYFQVQLSASDVGDAGNLDNTRVVVIRPGFSTHAMNMGQRYVQLRNTYTLNSDGSAVLNVNQLPPNPAILVPGPAMLFVVVNGVPSIGQWIMVGNGQLGQQSVSAEQTLPSFVGGDAGKNYNSGAGPQSQTHSGDKPFQTGKAGSGGGSSAAPKGAAAAGTLPLAFTAVAAAMVLFA